LLSYGMLGAVGSPGTFESWERGCSWKALWRLMDLTIWGITVPPSMEALKSGECGETPLRQPYGGRKLCPSLNGIRPNLEIECLDHQWVLPWPAQTISYRHPLEGRLLLPATGAELSAEGSLHLFQSAQRIFYLDICNKIATNTCKKS
jgi:hypothetical protein